MALANLLQVEGYGASVEPNTNPLAPKAPMFAPKAKNVIFMFMEGGPSQLDLFDPKPELAKWNGKPLPSSITKDLQLAFIKPTAAVLASQREFVKCGQSGMEISDFLPHLREVADDICLVRSMHTDAFNHHPGQLLLFSGTTQVGRPTIGAWVVYGLGSESQNLPGFVVLESPASAPAAARAIFPAASCCRRIWRIDFSRVGRADSVPLESTRYHAGAAARGSRCVARSQ